MSRLEVMMMVTTSQQDWEVLKNGFIPDDTLYKFKQLKYKLKYGYDLIKKEN